MLFADLTAQGCLKRAPLLARALRPAAGRTFNSITVDGDTSTNDTLVLLANGASGVRPDARELPQVEERIAQVMERLAQAIARDGEGARKFITIVVSGTSHNDGAARMARAIANSPRGPGRLYPHHRPLRDAASQVRRRRARGLARAAAAGRPGALAG